MYAFDTDGGKDVLKTCRNHSIHEVFYFSYILKVKIG